MSDTVTLPPPLLNVTVLPDFERVCSSLVALESGSVIVPPFWVNAILPPFLLIVCSSFVVELSASLTLILILFPPLILIDLLLPVPEALKV